MSLYVTKNDNIQGCVNTTVFLKAGQAPKIEIPGKVVSAESDNMRLYICTETTTSVFNIEDVICVRFANS